MCLTYDETSTINFKREHADDETVIAYKVYRKTRSNSLKSIIFGINRSIKSGVIKSNRGTTKIGISTDRLDTINRTKIYRGIHVYIDENLAFYGTDPRNDYCEIVVPVTCKMKDLVGVDGEGEAVFTEVYLTKKAYKKALKR